MTTQYEETTAARRHELELGQFIPLHYHFNMLNDVHRTGAFEEAIDLVVPEGGRVVELGGGTGILSFFAGRRAAHVWCVERNPELATVATQLLEENGADNVELVLADAALWTPPEPVDVVVCEMLHVGLLREKQIQVLAAFAENYFERHGGPLPRFVPEATVQAVQPVEQDYDFHGYVASTPFFQDGNVEQPRTLGLADPSVYHELLYENELTERICWDGTFTIAERGNLNALRVITKNLLAILPQEGRSVDWLMNYLVVPLAHPINVQPGDTIHVSIDYDAGAPLASFAPDVKRVGFAPR
ncbi:MAG: methyltransferase type 12 [Actinomycetia bacterium]|nr:methyltransferase type 12 [Actinomycetes bacterium]